MAAKKNLLTILVLFAQKQNSPHVHFAEFCDYMKRYAQHNIDTQPELISYTANPESAMHDELEALQHSGSIIITNPESDKKGLIVIPHYVERYASRYREIANNPTIPFPTVNDLPKQAPFEMIEQHQASTFMLELFEKEESEEKQQPASAIENENKRLYGLTFSNNVPTVILPSTITATLVFDIALSKIRQMLRKEEFHDYFLKRLRLSNSGKELSVKTFFNQVIQKPTEALESIKNSSDSFYFWSQLGFFIRQDYEKVTDYTSEHITILQSVAITDIAIGYYKNKAQQTFQRGTALRNLEQALNVAPHYFNRKAIEMFTDTRGIPLLGQYTADDLTEFLSTATTQISDGDLPELLTFKIHTGDRYYIYKTKVIPLIIRLSNDARENVKEILTKRWFELYKKFDSTPAMSDQKAFETCLENEVKHTSPILYALLQSNFLSLVHYDSQNNKEKIHLFSNGKLIPYSELLMLSRREISTDAKILLPVWYTIPVISWIARILFRPPKRRKKTGSIEPVPTAQLQLKNADEPSNFSNATKSQRRKEFHDAAQAAEAQIVPVGSTLDREMDSYIRQWNKLLDKQLSNNLTEDVNSLLRDYMRKTVRQIKASTFTLERMKNLADNVMQNPALQKISDKEQLRMYILLYIVKLTKTL